MKLTIKTLQQSTFKVDIEPEKTVKDLKDKIEKDHGKDFPSAAQKLIYSGKILADESKLAEYNIDEKKFVVLMITRPPPAPKPAPVVEKQTTTTSTSGANPKDESSSSSATTTTATTTTTGKKEDKISNKSSSSTTTTAPLTATANTTTTTTTTSSATATLATGVQSRPAGAGITSSSISNEQALSMSESQQMASRLATLMAEPQFRQIQDLIQQSPHLLSSTIEALAGTDPEMYSFISDNPDVFVSALNHPPLAGNRTHSSRGTTGNGGQQQQQQQRGEQRSFQLGSSPVINPAGRQQAGLDQILTDDRDKEAVERLKELGFPEFLAIQAYMACDRDEQLAANLLFQMEQ